MTFKNLILEVDKVDFGKVWTYPNQSQLNFAYSSSAKWVSWIKFPEYFNSFKHVFIQSVKVNRERSIQIPKLETFQNFSVLSDLDIPCPAYQKD